MTSTRARPRWVYNIKIYLKEVGCEGANWSHLAHGINRWRALVNTVAKLRIALRRGMSWSAELLKKDSVRWFINVEWTMVAL
jgi:hypothetical protein